MKIPQGGTRGACSGGASALDRSERTAERAGQVPGSARPGSREEPVVVPNERPRGPSARGVGSIEGAHQSSQFDERSVGRLYISRRGRRDRQGPGGSCSRPTRVNTRRSTRGHAGGTAGGRFFEIWDRSDSRNTNARTGKLPVCSADGGRECSGSRPGPRGRGRVSLAAPPGGLGDRRDGGDGRTRGALLERQRAPSVRLLGLDADPEALAAGGRGWRASATGFASCAPTSASSRCAAPPT